MQPKARDAAYVWDMLDAAKAVQEFVAERKFHEYTANRMLRGAVERQVEIIGEAANKVSKDFQTAHSEIRWQQIISQRNVLAHEYGEIEDELLWKVATVHIPVLIQQLEKILPPLPNEK
jgi:uncharacterized protein with HEPN domain